MAQDDGRWERILQARKMIDAAEYADVSNRTGTDEATGLPLVHWRVADRLVTLMPDTYKINTLPGSGQRIRNVKLHPSKGQGY